MDISLMHSVRTPLTLMRRLMWVYIALFVLSESVTVWFGAPWLEAWLCLPSHSGSLWQMWRLVTYSFLHASILHIGVNLWLFYSLARFLLADTLSTKRFLVVYGSGIVLGGIVWWMVHVGRGYHILQGISAGCLALLTYACLAYPQKTLSMLLFFICPIQLQARWILIGILAFEVFNGLVYELHNLTSIAHSAHLGGILAGWLMFNLGRFQSKTIRYSVHPSTIYSVDRSQDRSNN
ncbi:MAG: rhomboid family intramembrane serine protease [Opitutales bacterium]|nr:rhomboid family intramembrane serine protease [Opitutales bacterium]